MISYNYCGLFEIFKESLSANKPATFLLSGSSLQEHEAWENYSDWC